MCTRVCMWTRGGACHSADLGAHSPEGSPAQARRCRDFSNPTPAWDLLSSGPQTKVAQWNHPPPSWTRGLCFSLLPRDWSREMPHLTHLIRRPQSSSCCPHCPPPATSTAKAEPHAGSWQHHGLVCPQWVGRQQGAQSWGKAGQSRLVDGAAAVSPLDLCIHHPSCSAHPLPCSLVHSIHLLQEGLPLGQEPSLLSLSHLYNAKGSSLSSGLCLLLLHRVPEPGAGLGTQQGLAARRWRGP